MLKVTNKCEIEINDTVYYQMDNLKAILSDIPHPVFIVAVDTDTICEINKAAAEIAGSVKLIGKNLHQVVHLKPGTSISAPAFFIDRWWSFHEETISWNNKLFKKLVLKQKPSVPDTNTFSAIRNMIAVLLHRLRSPMTGMQGYLEMIEKTGSESDQRKLDKIDEGFDHLFEIMDDLEVLHNADTLDISTVKENLDPEWVIRDVLYNYPAEVRNRIIIQNPDNVLECSINRSDLNKILTHLIDNALEHPSGKQENITIHIESAECLQITNKGEPIPEEIVEKLFFPFVTSKANSMGIGLSLAQLLAYRNNASIFLTNNNRNKGITFSLLLSPTQY